MGTDPRIDRVMPVLGRAVARMEIPAVEKISEDSKNDAFQVLVSTLLSLPLGALLGSAKVTVAGMLWNLLPVTLGNIVVKGGARKVRRIYNDAILAGFAGGTADAFTLFERFESKLDKHQGHLQRAAIELTRDWRTDRVLRRLEAMLAVADRETSNNS